MKNITRNLLLSALITFSALPCMSNDVLTLLETPVKPHAVTKTAKLSAKPAPTRCDEVVYRDVGSNQTFTHEMGLTLTGTVGAAKADGKVILPICPAPVLNQEIIVPVLMVDWEDFNPVTDLSNPTNPDSTFPEYVKAEPQALQTYLNGEEGPAQYFKDTSGGQVSIRFEVIGWLKSDAPGSYLKPRSAYLQQIDETGQYYCKHDEIFLDAMRDAITLHNVDFNRYNSDRQISVNSRGFLDGVVLLYEGKTGMCSGTNVTGVYNENFLLSVDGLDSATSWSSIRDLVPTTDPSASKFANQDLLFSRYVNMPEQFHSQFDGKNNTAVWAHELGHLWMDYPDHYGSHHNFRNWALSTSSTGHPAAFEKWIYGHWIAPVDLNANGRYTLKANEIAQGTDYQTGTYLYRIPLSEDGSRYLTVENRWFADDGNTADTWSAPLQSPKSGALIMEFDWTKEWVEEANGKSLQIFRHVHQRETDSNPNSYLDAQGYRTGDVLIRCEEVYCIRLSAFTKAGPELSFEFKRFQKVAGDRDSDGELDEADVFPDNVHEWLDSDQDGIGDNADADDDNDGVEDNEDDLPFDASESLDTDRDGVGNNTDTDDDNDGVPDNQDAFPLDASESLDTDRDGIGNNADADDDNDNVPDNLDVFPLNPAESVDTDGDGIGNNADTDDDNDGVPDNQDAFPLDPTRSANPTTPPAESSGGGGGSVPLSLMIVGAVGLAIRRQRAQLLKLKM